MIKSMTGFGRSQASVEGYDITVEIKSVNHRYFEFSARMPRAYSFFEDKVKNLLSKTISRGKVECNILIDVTGDDRAAVSVNESLARGYREAISSLAETYDIKDDLTATALARFPDVLSVAKAPVDEDALWAKISPVIEDACKRFVEMREIEGARLRDDVLSRADNIIENVSFIEARSPETVKAYNDRLLEKIREVLGDKQIDESRVLTEAAIYADKVAVAEETVRLRSHIEQLHTMLDGSEAIGRKLDFLVQEINREANTIGSKAQDIEIARRVIDIKAEVEKIREQIQNIE